MDEERVASQPAPREEPSDSQQERHLLLEPVLRRLRRGEEVFGERLLVLTAELISLPGGDPAILTLDRNGGTVLILGLSSLPDRAGARLADELDRLAQFNDHQLAQSASDVASADELSRAHASFFDIPREHRTRFNQEQRAIVLVAGELDSKIWKELIVELGPQLGGVYSTAGDTLVPLEVPDELRAAPRKSAAAWVVPRWQGVVILLVVAFAAFLLGRGLAPRREEAGQPGTAGASAVRDVAAGVPAAATHNQWIGQQRLVRTSDGRLLAAYASDGGLQIVSDNSNDGRSWRAPLSVPAIRAVSFSMAIDQEDRLHVAYADNVRIAYATLQQTASGWESSALRQLDRSTSPYVDIDYDPAAGVAHVVWVKETNRGQQPQWAAVSSPENDPRLLDSGALAPPGQAIHVLVNVATGPRGALATYRRGDSPTGWFSRSLAANTRGFSWGAEERVPTEAAIGAAALAFDRQGVAHLVLRDSTSFSLTYFRWTFRRWSNGETAVDADSIEEIDFPSISVDTSSKLVYLFFQSDEAQSVTGVQFTVRDPATLWQPARPLALQAQIPQGAFNPAAMRSSHGLPVVLWTKQGSIPQLQAGLTPAA